MPFQDDGSKAHRGTEYGFSAVDQAPGGLDDAGQALGQWQVAERVRRAPAEIVEFVVQQGLAANPAGGE